MGWLLTAAPVPPFGRSDGARSVGGAPGWTHRPPPAGAGSVVNRCGGGWRPWQTRRPPPHRRNSPAIGSDHAANRGDHPVGRSPWRYQAAHAVPFASEGGSRSRASRPASWPAPTGHVNAREGAVRSRLDVAASVADEPPPDEPPAAGATVGGPWAAAFRAPGRERGVVDARLVRIRANCSSRNGSATREFRRTLAGLRRGVLHFLRARNGCILPSEG